MGHPVVRHRTKSQSGKKGSPLSSASSGRASKEPRLLPLLLPIFILGGLAMIHIVSLARLSELECQHVLLQRLSGEESKRQSKLIDERNALTNGAVLQQYAGQLQMVDPADVHPIKVGALPPEKIHWVLPDEDKPGALANAGQYGQALPASAPPRHQL